MWATPLLCIFFSFLPQYVKQKRFQNDKTINNTSVDVLQDQKWETVSWKNLQVGDIVRVSSLLSSVLFSSVLYDEIGCFEI